ncbi:PREDICTED: uncharacterized protein LOC105557116, partial [Vollenhovia emeryi]|uniref:uncharacterized protein LOC105557116 n=1 Tax=Vollenhovia emeryi TaxID=411798 RepID=UPI0005F4945C
MVSLDVTALFTNVPKELVLKGIENRWHEISKATKLSLPQFSHAIDLILSSTSFSFNDQIYEQIFGSPMGSPLSPILADIIMDDLETHCINSLDFEIQVYYRYVDDIFLVLPEDRLQEVLNTFNNYHPRLQFTSEIESNKTLNFLNVSVLRENNKMITN